MEKQFVPYELSVKLKELGFDELCLCHYHYGNILRSKIVSYIEGDCLRLDKFDKSTPSPLWQQAFDWFREKHNLVGNVYANASGYLFEIHHSAKKGGSYQHDSGHDGPNDSGCWDEYNNARQACLEKLIELVKGA